MSDPRYLFTIQLDHVNKSTIKVGDKTYYLGSVIGTVQRIDVGKRVYDVGGVIQVENDQQRDQRIATHGDAEPEPPCNHDPVAVIAGRCECGAVWDPTTRQWGEDNTPRRLYRLEIRFDFHGTETEARRAAQQAAGQFDGQVTAVFDEDWNEI